MEAGVDVRPGPGKPDHVARRDHLRAERGRGFATVPAERIEIPDNRPSAVDVQVEVEETRRLLLCLAALEARQQDAIRSAFYDGHTYEILALRAGVPLGTMKSWIRRGLLRLKACLREEPPT